MRTFKCKNCLERKPADMEVIAFQVYRFCCKACRQTFIRTKNKAAKNKIQVRKVKARTKKANSISTLTKKADKLCSEVIRMEGVCEYNKCDKTEHLNAHHIIGRSNKGLRWKLSNGICLCAGHHIFSSSFSAHKQPLLFTKRLEWYKGTKTVEKLTTGANMPFKVTSEYLHEVIKEFGEILNKTKNENT